MLLGRYLLLCFRYYNDSSVDSGYGYFDDHSYTININEHYFNTGKMPGQEMLDTMAHEYRHCWQFNNLGFDDISQSYIHYVSYEPKLGNWDAYYYQACEVDSRTYAEIWTALLKGLI